MTEAFQIRTAYRSDPKFDFSLWDGTNMAEVVGLLKNCEVHRANEITTTVGPDGELINVAPYWRFVIPAGMYLVRGPYWGGELWNQPYMGAVFYEWINPALFANRFPDA